MSTSPDINFSNLDASPETPPNDSESTPNKVDPFQERYYALTDRLLACPNGEEPTVLNAEPEVSGFVQALMQTASYFTHQSNADVAKFLIFIARELSHQLGLYLGPKSGANVSPDLATATSLDSGARPGVL